MPEIKNLKILFVINPKSGNTSIDYKKEIQSYFSSLEHVISLFELPENSVPEMLKKELEEKKPDRIVAVGGDGTVKLVAEAVLNSQVPMGIIPGGSANGMAKELKIPLTVPEALDIIINGRISTIHAVMINQELCIHLADIGFNAFVVKKFETAEKRGMWGYIKAAWKVFWSNRRMSLTIETDGKTVKRDAAMVVIANATQYGTGVVINPKGKLSDDLFEVVIVRKVSLKELYKMKVTHNPFDPDKTEVFQTCSLEIRSQKAAHFQVDGEYLGKVYSVRADIIKDAVSLILPD